VISHGGVADGCTLTGSFSNVPANPGTIERRKLSTKPMNNRTRIFVNLKKG
jgi:hypothetical protein